MKLIFAGDFNPSNDDIKISSSLSQLLRESDGVIVNLEGYFCKCEDFSKSLCINEEKFLKAVASMNILAVSIANNHSLDGGEKCFWYTLDFLKKNDIKILGLKENPLIVLNKSVIYSAVWDKTGVPKIAKELIEVLSKRDFFNKLKEGFFDTVDVFYIHWGLDMETLPLPWQIDFARGIEKTLIVGHHSHIPQPIFQKVFFSLGNFYMPENEVTVYYPSSARSSFLLILENDKIEILKTTYHNGYIDIILPTIVPEFSLDIIENYEEYFKKGRSKKHLPAYDGSIVDMFKFAYLVPFSLAMKMPWIRRLWVIFKRGIKEGKT